MHKKEKGFTLIELLVVIAILGILAAVVVPNVSKFIGKGDTESNETEVKNVRLAVTALLADSGGSSLSGGTVNTYAQAQAVGTGSFTLDDYLDINSGETLKCTYTVSNSGTVTQSC